jgi:hypothetical protein
MRPVTIAVLGKFPDIFDGFVESANKYLPTIPKVFVRDGKSITMPTGVMWTNIQGPLVFSNPGNANIAWQAAAPDSDILYCGDDVRFLQPNTWELLQDIAYSDPKIGMLSPRIVGSAGNNLQLYPLSEGITYSHQRLALICTYIKRETIEAVGWMDPVFGGSYGYDDDDYNHRVQLAGYSLAVTSRVSVEHQHAGSTFARTGPGVDCRTGAEKFQAKWGAKAVAQIAADVAKDTAVVQQTLPPLQPIVRSTRAPQRLRRG